MKVICKVLPIFLILIISGCTTAEGQTTEVRTFNGVDGVVLMGSGNVDIIHGSKNEITINAPADLIPYLITEVKDGSLQIGKRKKGWKKFRHFNENISYDIIVKDIDHVKVSGSGNLVADKLKGTSCFIKVSGSGNVNVGHVNGGKITVVVSGSGDISMDNANGNVMAATISGSGDIDIDGKVDELDITISGSGDFDGDDLKAEDASVDIYGSGDAVFGCKESLKASIYGSGDVVYHGNPSVNSKTKGSGDIRHR